jgi:hypothetical protein
MAPATIVMLSSVLTYGAPIAFAVYEIWSIRREPPPRDDRRPPAAPRAPKPLPDCLLPKPVPVRERRRELEDA